MFLIHFGGPDEIIEMADEIQANTEGNVDNTVIVVTSWWRNNDIIITWSFSWIFLTLVTLQTGEHIDKWY